MSREKTLRRSRARFPLLSPTVTDEGAERLPEKTLSVTAYAVPAPPKGELLGIFRLARIKLPLSGELASRSDD